MPKFLLLPLHNREPLTQDEASRWLERLPEPYKSRPIKKGDITRYPPAKKLAS